MNRHFIPRLGFASCLGAAVLTAPAGAAILTVGATGTYGSVAAAVAAANSGDTIQIQAGTYVNDDATINVPLTIEGIGGPVILEQTAAEMPNLKGFLVINANTTVQNITFQGAAVSDGDGGNGAGIRYQAGNLTVSNSQFIGNQDGILGTPGSAGMGSIVIQNSTFTGNGDGSGAYAGHDHAIYVGTVASLTVSGSTFNGTILGHDIKSRAATTVVTDNTLDDGVTGTTSYAVDLPDGGAATVSGNTINQGLNTSNSTMISYAEEDTSGATWTTNSLLVSGNLFNNTYPNGAYGVVDASTVVTASVSCNAFDSVSTPVTGLQSLFGNVLSGGVPSCGLPSSVPEPSARWVFGSGLVLLLLAKAPRPARRAIC